MATSYLISTQMLKDQFPMSTNIDDKWIRNSIIVAQDMYLRGTSEGYDGIMGKVFYDAFMTRWIAESLTAAEVLLVPYIRNVLTYMSMNEALPFLKDKIVNTGVQNQNPDQNTQTAETPFYRMIAQNKKIGEYYMQVMKDYLCEHKADFPEYILTNNRPDSDDSNSWPILTKRRSSCGCGGYRDCTCN